MGLFQGSAALTRYRIKGELPESFTEFINQRIKLFAFRPIEESTEELATGWVAAHDYLDTRFAYAAYYLEPYIMLGFRVDQRKVPAALLKKYHRMEIMRVMAQSEEDKPLSRSQKEELKERTRLALLHRIPPGTKSYDVCWDTQKGEVWLGSSGSKVREMFEDLFKRCFELPLVPLIPWTVALEAMETPEQKTALEAARPLSLYAGEN